MLFKGKRPTYFNVFFVAMVAILLTRIYYLIMSFSSEFDSVEISIGVLGFASAYLFFIVANKTYVPLETAEINEKKICVLSLIIACVVIAPLIAILFVSFNVKIIIFVLFNILTIAPCVYCCTKSIRNVHNNPFRRATKISNLCVIAIALSHSLYEGCYLFVPTDFIDIAIIVLDAICIVATIIILPSLKKGLEPWEI